MKLTLHDISNYVIVINIKTKQFTGSQCYREPQSALCPVLKKWWRL